MYEFQSKPIAIALIKLDWGGVAFSSNGLFFALDVLQINIVVFGLGTP